MAQVSSSQNAQEASAPKLTAGLLTMFSVPVLWRKGYGWLYRAQWSLRKQLRVFFFFVCFQLIQLGEWIQVEEKKPAAACPYDFMVTLVNRMVMQIL